MIEKTLKNVTDDADGLDEESGRKGMSRMELMAKLARDHVADGVQPPSTTATPAPVESRCVLLKNMFDPAKEAADAGTFAGIQLTQLEPGVDWAAEIEADVRDECAQFGSITHCFVDPASKGHVYIRFSTPAEAQAAQTALSGRFFAGQQVVCDRLSDPAYRSRFPELRGVE